MSVTDQHSYVFILCSLYIIIITLNTSISSSFSVHKFTYLIYRYSLSNTVMLILKIETDIMCKPVQYRRTIEHTQNSKEFSTNMADQQHSSSEYKHMSLDKIIEAMTADLQNSTGSYIQFGVTNQQTQPCTWTECSPNQVQHCMVNSTMLTNSSNIQEENTIISPLYMQNVSQYNFSTRNQIYFPSQTVNHLNINENNDLIGTIDAGGGNFINVIYGNASQIMAGQCQLSDPTSYNNNQGLIDQDYELFNSQQSQVSFSSNTPSQNSNGKRLIDNLVGNWIPNQSGTYSPFGGSPNVTPALQSVSERKEIEESPINLVGTQLKKSRIVAEVKSMRPSYSDVLIKSVPTLKPKQESTVKKISNKNSKNKTKIAVLKRQNSSGSDEHDSPKFQLSKKAFEKMNVNLSRRWVSLDNLGIPIDSSDLLFDKSDNFEKKKTFKSCKRNEKGETLNNTKNQNNSTKNTPALHKRPIQINNNLSSNYSFSQTISSDKIEKNQQLANNKIKEDKKLSKEKSSKHFHAEKAQQIKKGQRNRKRENKDTHFRDIYKIVHRYFNSWSKIGLKIFLWFLHLIFDIISMSTNLAVQLSKCVWYHVVLYLKYSWSYIISTLSKIRFLNSIGKQIDNRFGNSRFAFWRRLKSRSKEKEESSNCVQRGLEVNIALPSSGEEAMKRLLACKGKDPYSILGVTPTCSDDDIKKYYKRQAFLVHPDKNNQPGAEEAFKILVHAFDIIGEPERRQAFDQTRQVEAAWCELSDLLSQLHRKMEQAANTIRCTNCGMRHKRIPTQRPCYAARFCSQCKIRHSAKEGDIWAESRIMGFLWHYYACMEGAVYDVTDWAACQANNLKHLKANTHTVQYRIVLGQRPPSHSINNNQKQQSDSNFSNKAEFEDFLNNLYNHSKTGTSNAAPDLNNMKGDNRRRKMKRKK